MRMVVLGLGYLGATHAACMAELGHEVLGVETQAQRREILEKGQTPFFEPGLEELLSTHVSSGRLRITDSYAEAAEFADVFFIAVGTPQKKGEYATDLRHVQAAIDTLAPLLKRDALVLGKSTVPAGTTEILSVRAQKLTQNIKIEIAWNPEFLREGHAIQDTLNPDRLVLGRYVGGTAEQLTNEIYADLLASGTPLLVTDPTTAELVKTAANAFLATKISFINAIAEISDLVGANVTDIADAMGYDDRIGRKFLNAGLGFGGGCLPKDIRGLMARAGELGAAEAVAFLREVDNINMRRRMRMVEVARECCGGNLVGARIAILGAAFKPDSDDVRDSPALNVAGQLQLSGAMVTVYDPKSNENSRAVFPTLEYADSALDASRAADLVLVLTEWRELTELDPNDLSAVVARKYIVDGRRCLDRRRWEASGWGYRA